MDWGDGAGFTNDSIAEDPHQLTKSVSVAGDDRSKVMAAVSVSQVSKLTRPNEGLIIHGRKIYHINLVAFVCEIIDINQTKVHLLVADQSGGGPLEVSHIIGDTGTPGQDPSLSMFQDDMAATNSDEPRSIHSVGVDDYVRIIGVVKYTQDKPNVVAYCIRIIDDPNEITMHMMEVIRDSLYYQKLQTSGGALPPIVDYKPLGQINNNSNNNNNNSNNSHQVPGDMGQLSTRDKHMLTFLRAKAKSEGMHIDDIARNFPAFTRDDIEKSLTQLSQEGLCWTGEDENVWCAD